MSAYGLVDGVSVRAVASYVMSGRATNINFLSGAAPAETGGYRNVVKVFYGGSAKEKPASTNIATSKDSAKDLSAVGKAVTELNQARSKFLENADDRDAVLEKTNQFLENYNTVLAKVNDIHSDSLKIEAKKLADYTKTNESRLAQIGIRIHENGALSMEEKHFRKVDTDKVNTIFLEDDEYGYSVERYATMIGDAVKRELLKANTYNQFGAYTSNYSFALNSYI